MATEATPLVHSCDEREEDGLAATAVIYLTALTVASTGIADLAAQYFLKDTWGFGPAEVAVTLSFHSVGWVIKPVWGLISDCFPIGKQRRKPYLLIVSGVGALAFHAFGWVQTVWQFVLVLVLAHSCMSFLTVIAQALLVQRSGAKGLGHASFNFSSYFGVKTMAFGFAAYYAGVMLEHYSPRRVLMSAAAPFIILHLATPWMSERPSSAVLAPMQQWATISALFRRPEVWGTSLYIFVFCAMPKPTVAMFFFSVDVLGFSSDFMAIVTMVSSVAYVCGIITYHKFLTDVPFRQLFAVATLVCTAISATPLIQVFRLNRAWGIDDHVFALVDTFVISAVAEVLWIPMLVLASRLCPPSAEGTAFALFLSINNLGLWASGALSGGLTSALGVTSSDHSNLWLLVSLCTVATLVPLAFLPLVPNVDPEQLRCAEPVVAGSENPQEA